MDVTDELALDKQLCFALYAASRATTAVYRPLLDELGLTYPQYLVMLVLWERDGRGVREIGDALDLDTGTLSPLLKRIEALGLIERRRASDDERRVHVHLTESGHALRERATSVPRRLASCIDLPPDELVELHQALQRLTRALRPETAPAVSTEKSTTARRNT